MSEKDALGPSFASNGRGHEIPLEEATTILAISPQAIRYLMSAEKILDKAMPDMVGKPWFGPSLRA